MQVGDCHLILTNKRKIPFFFYPQMTCNVKNGSLFISHKNIEKTNYNLQVQLLRLYKEDVYCELNRTG